MRLGAGEAFAEILHQRIAQDFLDGTILLAAPRILAESLRQPQPDPVGRPVAGATEALWVDEGLEVVDRVPI